MRLSKHHRRTRLFRSRLGAVAGIKPRLKTPQSLAQYLASRSLMWIFPALSFFKIPDDIASHKAGEGGILAAYLAAWFGVSKGDAQRSTLPAERGGVLKGGRVCYPSFTGRQTKFV